MGIIHNVHACTSCYKSNSSSLFLCHFHSQGDGLTALHYASMKGKVDLVKMLLRQGADPNTQDNVSTIEYFPHYSRCIINLSLYLPLLTSFRMAVHLF